MRIALIVLDQDDAAGAVHFAGRSLASGQLAIALAAGCERVIALGTALDQQALALQHEAEAAGAAFVLHPALGAVAGTVTARDELLVFAPAILPDRAVVAGHKGGAVVHAFPAEVAVARGFERIDADSAWAGVLVAPGAILERIADLPDDCDAAGVLLRAALQAGIGRNPLDSALIQSGRWLARPEQAQCDERALAAARAAADPAPFSAPGSALADRLAIGLWRGRGAGRAARETALAALAAGAGAVALAAAEWTVTGCALLVVMALLARMTATCHRIDAAVIGEDGAPLLARAARAVRDPAFAATFACAAPEAHDWLRLYVPVALMLTLRLAARHAAPRWRAGVADRVALAAASLPAAWFGLTQGFAALVTVAALVLVSLPLRAGDG